MPKSHRAIECWSWSGAPIRLPRGADTTECPRWQRPPRGSGSVCVSQQDHVEPVFPHRGGSLGEQRNPVCFSHLRLRLWDASGRLTGDSSSEMPQGSWGCLQGDSSLSLPALQGGTTHSLFLMSLQLTPLRSKSLLPSAEVPQAQSTPGLLVCFQIKFPISHFSVTLKK